MHTVMIHSASYEDCRQAVNRAFELFPLKLAGKRVLVKPNALRAAGADEGVVSHPSVLRAVVEKLEESSPAAIVVGDNPGALSYGANEAAFRQSGLMEAAKGYYQNIGTNGIEVPFNPDFDNLVRISTEVQEADVIISIPKFKTHALTTLTGAIKNSYGFLPGGQKATLHLAARNPWRFGELIVDVFNLRVPELFIVDAIIGMEGNGPASKDLRPIGKILASDSAVALDATISRMMGLSPGGLRFLQVAKERGLGDYDSASIAIDGELQPIKDFKLPPMAVSAEDISPADLKALHSCVLLRPSVDDEFCTGCGTCVVQCPASALSMRDNLPEVNAERCITCFCCQEMCPEKAIQLR